MSSKVELTKPKGEDWNVMFKDAKVREVCEVISSFNYNLNVFLQKVARLEQGKKAQKVEVEKLAEAKPQSMRILTKDLFTEQIFQFSNALQD